MKKNILLASVAFAALTIASCKRDYTCTCKYTTTFKDVSTTKTKATKYVDVTKKQAKQACKLQDTWSRAVEIDEDEKSSNSDFKRTGSCELK